MAKGRRRFDGEFKRQAVRLASEPGQSLSQVARELDVRSDMLRRWKKQDETEGKRAFPGQGHARDEEISRLQRELRRVTEERDILKKAVAIFSEPGR